MLITVLDKFDHPAGSYDHQRFWQQPGRLLLGIGLLLALIPAFNYLLKLFAWSPSLTAWQFSGGIYLLLIVSFGWQAGLLVAAGQVLSGIFIWQTELYLVLAIAVGNWLAYGLAGHALRTRLGGKLDLRHWRGVIWLALFAGLGSMLAAGWNSMVYSLVQPADLTFLLSLFLRQTAGALISAFTITPLVWIFTPLILNRQYLKGWLRQSFPLYWVEMLLQLVVLGVAVVLIVNSAVNDDLHVEPLVFVPVFWYALRFGIYGAAFSTFMLNMCVGLILTILGPANVSVSYVQASLFVITAMTYALGVLSSERKNQSLSLQRSEEQARQFAAESHQLYLAAEQHTRKMELLNQMTHAAIQATSSLEIYQTLADRMGELLGADGAYITLWDAGRQLTVPVAAYGRLKITYPQLQIQPGEVTMTASVLNSGCTLVAENVFDTPYMSARIAAMFPTRSMIGLPLIADGEKLGAALISFEQPQAFTPQQIALGELAAAQAALAIAKTRSIEAERQQRQRMARANRFISTLAQVAAQTTRLRDLDDVLHTLGDSLMNLGISCAVLLPREQPGAYHFQYFNAPPGVTELIEELIGESLTTVGVFPEDLLEFERIIQHGQQVVLSEMMPFLQQALVKATPAELERLAVLLRRDHAMGMLMVPLILASQPIGMLWLLGQDLDQDDLPAANLFASQVAIAIDNARMYEESRRLAVTDGLTGLYNRRHFFERVAGEVERAARYGYALGLLIIDIDNFKQVNDTYGHPTGDQVLRELAGRFQKMSRQTDLLGRYGGEEFVLLVIEGGAEEAQIIAERIRANLLTEPFFIDGLAVTVTASIGAAAFEPAQSPTNVDWMVAIADSALYRAKQAGRNRVVFYAPPRL